MARKELILNLCYIFEASLGAQLVKNPPAMQEPLVRSFDIWNVFHPPSVCSDNLGRDYEVKLFVFVFFLGF